MLSVFLLWLMLVNKDYHHNHAESWLMIKVSLMVFVRNIAQHFSMFVTRWSSHNNNEIIHGCYSYFKFSLPTELLENRRVKLAKSFYFFFIWLKFIHPGRLAAILFPTNIFHFTGLGVDNFLYGSKSWDILKQGMDFAEPQADCHNSSIVSNIKLYWTKMAPSRQHTSTKAADPAKLILLYPMSAPPNRNHYPNPNPNPNPNVMLSALPSKRNGFFSGP